MAALSGKLVSKIEIKSDGNVFHQLLRDETNRISSLSPEKVHGVELVDGAWGTRGSVICWKYVLGKHLFQYFILIKHFTPSIFADDN